MSRGGAVRIRGNTSIADNVAESGNDWGHNMVVSSGTVDVFFPLLPGHWLPSAECRVYREGCAFNDRACEASFASCALTPEAPNETAPGCTRRSFIQPCGPVAPTRDAPRRAGMRRQCSSTAVDRCDWMNDHSLLTVPLAAV